MSVRRMKTAVVGQTRSLQTILTAIGFCVLHAWTGAARGRGANSSLTLLALFTLWRLVAAQRALPWRGRGARGGR